jgi:hypothetical protein
MDSGLLAALLAGGWKVIGDLPTGGVVMVAPGRSYWRMWQSSEGVWSLSAAPDCFEPASDVAESTLDDVVGDLAALQVRVEELELVLGMNQAELRSGPDARTFEETEAEAVVREGWPGSFVMPYERTHGWWIVIMPAGGWPKPAPTRAGAWDNAVDVLNRQPEGGDDGS